jgi:hypothetical protein
MTPCPMPRAWPLQTEVRVLKTQLALLTSERDQLQQDEQVSAARLREARERLSSAQQEAAQGMTLQSHAEELQQQVLRRPCTEG